MKHKKILLLLLTLALFASVFACSDALAQQLEPWNVVVDVVHKNSVYRYNLKQQTLSLRANVQNRCIFSSFVAKKSLANSLLRQGLPPVAVYEYVLPGFSKILSHFAFIEVEKCDATVTFDKVGFHYTQSVDGVSVDAEKLFFQMLESRGRKISVQLPLAIDKAVTVGSLKQNTVKKGSFTTSFALSGENRCCNVKLACDAVNGTTVMPGESFSFNQTVGPRTQENGYRQSKVILDGMYADGVGGGVCQVSTTLYNALLLSEIVPSACQHTLVSSYVLAGFDAMVSDSGADLTFTNNTEYPLYIVGSVNLQNKTITFTMYGRPNCYRVERESVETRTKFATVEIVDSQKYPELVYTDQFKVVTGGSDGVQSASYLNFYDGEKLVCRKLIRQNSYKKVDMVVARGSKKRDTEQ